MSICRKVYPLVVLLCLHHGSSHSTHLFSFKTPQPGDVTHSSGRSAPTPADITYFSRTFPEQLAMGASRLAAPSDVRQAVQDYWHLRDGALSTTRYQFSRPPHITRKAACRDWYFIRNCDPHDDRPFGNEAWTHPVIRPVTNTMTPSASPTLLAAPGNVIASLPQVRSRFYDLSDQPRVAKKQNLLPWEMATSRSQTELNQKFGDHDQNFDVGNELSPIVIDEDLFESEAELTGTQPKTDPFLPEEGVDARMYLAALNKRDGKRIPRGWGPYSILYINRPPQNDISYKSDTAPIPTPAPEVNVPRSAPLRASGHTQDSAAEHKIPTFPASRPPRPEGLRIITLPHLHATYGWGAFGQ